MNSKNNRDKIGIVKHLTVLIHIGINMVVATLVGYFIGKVLDDYFNTTPYLTVIFLILGIAAAFKEVFRVAMRQIKEDID